MTISNYKFQKVSYSDSSLNPIYHFGLNLDYLKDDELSLQLIESHTWTPQKIQDLIDECNNLEVSSEIEYKAEGSNLFMIIDINEVYFYNSLENKQEEDFIWSLEKFIQFLEDFKQFVANNQ